MYLYFYLAIISYHINNEKEDGTVSINVCLKKLLKSHENTYTTLNTNVYKEQKYTIILFSKENNYFNIMSYFQHHKSDIFLVF